MLKIIRTVIFTGLWLNIISVSADSYVIPDLSVGTTVTIGGTVVPFQEVTFSAQLPGRIKKVAGEEGTAFEKGNTLVLIDDAELQAKRSAVLAQRRSAQATLYNASVQYERELRSPDSPDKSAPGGMGLPHMFDQIFTKPASDMMGQSDAGLDRYSDLSSYGSQVEQARSTIMQIDAQLKQIDTKLRDARSISPFNGVITKKFVEVGDTIQPGMPLLKFADTKYLQVEVDVPARLIPGLKVGMDNIPVQLDVFKQPDRPIPTRVAQIFPTADPQNHTIKVKFDLPINIHMYMPESVRVGPGQYAEVTIKDVNVEPQKLAIIPRDAVVWRGSLPSIYLLKDNKRELRLVRLGRFVTDSRVKECQKPQSCYAVLSGVTPGDTIERNPAPGTTSGWVSEPPANHAPSH